MSLPNSFSNNTTPTGPQLDANEAALGNLGTLPCTVAGTNTLTLTLAANTPTINAYSNYLRFSGVAAATNTGATTARVGALAALNIYRDSPAGPVALAGGEIVIACAFTLVYDSALDTGAGGWHLISTANAFPYTGGSISNGTISLVNGTLSTVVLTGASISTPTLNVTGIGSLATLNFAGGQGTLSTLNVTGIGSLATLNFAGGQGTLSTLNVTGSGSLAKLLVGATAASVTRILSQLGTLAYTITPAQSAQDQAMTLTGVQLGDSISLGVTLNQASCVFTGIVPAAGTVNVRLLNAGSGTIGAFTLVARATAHGFT